MKQTGLVGRMVTVSVARGSEVSAEPCEVMACQSAGERGWWRLLVATRDGQLLDVDPSKVVLAAEPGDGPYR